MMSALAPSTIASDLTSCPICLGVFDNPKSLPCIHGFCLKCLEGHFKDKCPGDEVSCPLCRKEFTIPPDGLIGLQHHFFLQHLADARNSSSKLATDVPCEVCSEENEGNEGGIPVATIYCVDCDEKLCDRCSKPHRRLKRGGHQMRPLGANVETEMLHLRRTLCDVHEEEPVKLYCYECDENVCLMCSAVTHKQHETAEIPDAANTFSFQIDSDARRVAAQAQSIREKLRDKDKTKTAFISEVDRVKKEIELAGNDIKGIVDNQVTTWLNETALVQSADEKNAEMVGGTYQLALVAKESFHKYSRELLDKGRPSDITRAASELHKRATELLGDDVTSVQYSPTHVTFAPVDVTQLTSINIVGQVTVGDGQRGLAETFVPIDRRLKLADGAEKELMKQVSSLQEETRLAVQKENKTLENNISLEAQIKEDMERHAALNDQLQQAQSELARVQSNENELQQQLKERSDNEESLNTQLAQVQLNEKRLQLEQLQKSESEDKLQQNVTKLQHRTTELERQLQAKSESQESLSLQLKTTTESAEQLRLQLNEKLETEEQLKALVKELKQSEAKLNQRVAELSAKETEITQKIEKLSKSEQQFKIKLREEGERRSELQKRCLEMTEQELKQRQMGHVVHTLPEGLSVYGVATLDRLLYVLRDKTIDQVEVFDTESYRLQRCINVPGLGSRDDLIVCQHNRCLYLSDAGNTSVHRVALLPDGGITATEWPVNDRPACLSLTDSHCVLVTCVDVRKIKQFSGEGRLVRILSVPFIAYPWHAIQLSDGQFAVCHGGPDDQEHRVCLLGYDGHVVKSYGGPKGPGLQLNVPSHLAVDKNGFIYVVDRDNRRVLLLSPALTYVREVLSREQLKCEPQRLFVDESRQQMIVGYRTSSFDAFRADAQVKRTGRAVVVSI